MTQNWLQSASMTLNGPYICYIYTYQCLQLFHSFATYSWKWSITFPLSTIRSRKFGARGLQNIYHNQGVYKLGQGLVRITHVSVCQICVAQPFLIDALITTNNLFYSFATVISITVLSYSWKQTISLICYINIQQSEKKTNFLQNEIFKMFPEMLHRYTNLRSLIKVRPKLFYSFATVISITVLSTIQHSTNRDKKSFSTKSF